MFITALALCEPLLFFCRRQPLRVGGPGFSDDALESPCSRSARTRGFDGYGVRAERRQRGLAWPDGKHQRDRHPAGGKRQSRGADNVFLRLNQDGEFNSLSIDQYGWSNSVGSVFLAPGRPSGTNQVGDRNTIDIRQRNSEPDGSGFNLIGTVYQSSSRLISAEANSLLIRQTEDGGLDLSAGHRVNSVSQTHSGLSVSANRVAIWQSAGGNGLGNVADQMFQSGTGNEADVFQSGQENAIGLLQQMGDANSLTAEQGNGQSNDAKVVQQLGNLNRMSIRQSGSRNVIQQALQNNEFLGGGGVGNRTEVVLVGEDNGGDGLGGVGDFLADATRARGGVSQGDLVQLGDDNDIRLTVVQGSLTKFGFMQVGDGNGALVAIGTPGGATATGNEAAIFQDGLDNQFALTVLGNESVASAAQIGEGNRLEAFQTGDRNVLVADMAGDENNAPSLGTFAGVLSPVTVGTALMPGMVVQTGLSHSALIGVTGSRNLFGVSQTGLSHQSNIHMTGVQNQTAVVQTGSTNTSLSVQSGSGNALAVRQF